MKNGNLIRIALATLLLCSAAISTSAQSINLWRGSETKADWEDAFKWKLKHTPSGEEAVHFRQTHGIVAVNSTIELNNGMMLYGQELSLQGNGNINLLSPITHKSTVNIPASATGKANLTLNDHLSLNGRIALAANAFGTSASKGSVTLKDRSTLSGTLAVGNNGSGSGQIFVRDQSTYRITGLELNTLAEKGGSAEIHILGGTVYLETKTNPFDIFLADPSRKIILSDDGTLLIDSPWSVSLKKNAITKMIREKHIVAASGCELTLPIFQRSRIVIKAKTTATPQPIEELLADIANSRETKMPVAPSVTAPALATTAPKQPSSSKSTRLASLLQDMPTSEPSQTAESATQNADGSTKKGTADAQAPLAGYIVFFSAALFFLRPVKQKS